jgi:tRNA G18 (ribose-2'-O)-methylase SpoU
VLAGHASLRVFEASTETIRAVAGFKFHRGCLALGERGQPTPPDEVIAGATPRVLVALDGVADPDNVGAVFRNAAAFGAAGVLLSAGSADPLYRKAIRVSMGATLSTPFSCVEWADGLAALKRAGYLLVALTPEPRAEPIEAAFAARHRSSDRVALIVGAEGSGLGEESRAAADVRVRIAMAPGVDSLNVATACGIALHRLRSGIMSGDGP